MGMKPVKGRGGAWGLGGGVRASKIEKDRKPPKWLLNCFKLVISVIREESIAEACSIRWNGDSLCLSLLCSLFLSLPLSSFLLCTLSCASSETHPSFGAAGARTKSLYITLPPHVISVKDLIATERSCVATDTWKTF